MPFFTFMRTTVYQLVTFKSRIDKHKCFKIFTNLYCIKRVIVGIRNMLFKFIANNGSFRNPLSHQLPHLDLPSPYAAGLLR